MSAQLDEIYTTDEAAKRLRLTRRGIIKLAKHHGLCSRYGREYLFSELDLLQLWEVMREPMKERLFSHCAPRISDYEKARRLIELTAKKKKPNRLQWEATNAKNKELRDATKEALRKWENEPPLDHSRRDAEYWTPERKERRRIESLAKKKGWMART